MNDKKAKKIRKEIYSGTSIRQERDYVVQVHGVGMSARKTGAIINRPDSLRAIYQKAKRNY